MVVFKMYYPVVIYSLIQPRAGGGFLWHIWLVCPPLAFYDPDRYSAKLKDQEQTRDIKVWRLLTNDGHHRRITLASGYCILKNNSNGNVTIRKRGPGTTPWP